MRRAITYAALGVCMGLNLITGLGCGWVKQQGGGPPPFSPSDISGLLLWVKSDTGVTTSGGNMTGWADQSGNGNNIVPMGISAATYTASDSDYNGKPSIANALKTSANLSYSSFTIFAVSKVTQNPAHDWLYGHQSNYPSDHLDIADATSSITQSWWVKNASGTLISGPALGANWAYTQGKSTFVFAYDGTTTGSKMRLNGVAQTVSGTNHTPTTTTALFCWLGLGAGDQSNTGTTTEIIIYNSALSLTDIQSVESYLRTRYGHY